MSTRSMTAGVTSLLAGLVSVFVAVQPASADLLGQAPGGAAAVVGDQRSIALTPLQTQVVAVTPPVAGQSLPLVAWLDRQDGAYALGDRVTVSVVTGQPAYVYVFAVDAAGEKVMLLPNPMMPANQVAAGQVLQFPPAGASFQITAAGPAGAIDLIKVVATNQPVDFAAAFQMARAGNFDVVQDADFARRLELTLTTTAAPPAAPPLVWSQANLLVRTVAAPVAVAQAPIFVPTPAGPGLTIATDRPVYRAGELAQIWVTSPTTCALTLLNVNQAGQTTVLLPNPWQPSNMIQAGQTIVLPGQMGGYQFVAAGAGVEQLIGVCRTDGTTQFADQINLTAGVLIVLPATTDYRALILEPTQPEPADRVLTATTTFVIVP